MAELRPHHPWLLSGTWIYRLTQRPFTFMPSVKLHLLQLFVLAESPPELQLYLTKYDNYATERN